MNEAADARGLAARSVARVLRDGVTLEVAAQSALLGAAPGLAPAIRSLSYGAIRGFYRHEAILARLMSQPVSALQPFVRALLSVALFELEDARTPAYAIVDAAVNSAKGAGARTGGLVNALLRRFLRERAALEADIRRDPAARHAAPAWLAQLLRADWPDHWIGVLAAVDAQAPMWLRVDSRRTAADEFVARLRQMGIGARAEPRVPYSVVLDQPCDVHDLPGFDAGLVSVQDLGAQCVAFPLALQPGQRVLDACAAPGGKTALMAERESGLREILAIDVDRSRLSKVAENLQRGALRAALQVADAGQPAAWWDGVPFERILLDAPCSGLGVIRRHPDIRLRKSPADMEKLPRLQGRLLQAAWSMLARGGRLVYATCTFARRENHDVLAAFLRCAPDAEIVPPARWPGWPDFGQGDELGQQILPGQAGADGFYYAAVNKR
ncbi:MAG TPA: 16S rRNA (cytosine(967)-C(5))-methyltransferase RsmB [Steroidobacteraceae bacterium]|nr:16S rRNA (cytosine(967)-C(5))-methyltransferase RsmB [Steroidobacteraceae bacterium]